MILKKWFDVHALRIAVRITMLALLLAGSANAANGLPHRMRILKHTESDKCFKQWGYYFSEKRYLFRKREDKDEKPILPLQKVQAT